jgi:plasmid replication initiation protein
MDIFMTYQQIVAVLNFDGKRRISKRKEVFDMLDELDKAPIFWEDSKNEVKANWLSSITRFKDIDTFRLRIDPALAPYLLQLKEHFTEYFFIYIFPMEPASIRLYGLLKSYHSGTGVIEKIFEVDEFKFRLGLQGRYQKFYELKRWIILPGLEQVGQYTDLLGRYSIYEKSGKTVKRIKFQISPNLNNNKPISPKAFFEKIEKRSKKKSDRSDLVQSSEIFQMMKNYGVEEQKNVRAIIERCNEDEAYQHYVIDTIDRCKKDFEKNPNIENTG